METMAEELDPPRRRRPTVAMTRRYGIYWTPPASHPLWRAGCEWLGCDPATGAPGRARPHRAAPRRYGFHATLKPPFLLREGRGEAELDAALAALAAALEPFVLRPLRVDMLDDFIALRPCEPVDAQHPLRRLADACVRELDPLRRPAGAAERARRAGLSLDANERAHLERWGYPWVFDCWRFHMTLSDKLAAGALRDALLAEAADFFAPALAAPLRCDALALAVEDTPGADFRLVRRIGFGR
jgi:putative phosphonate metabolism protein